MDYNILSLDEKIVNLIKKYSVLPEGPIRITVLKDKVVIDKGVRGVFETGNENVVFDSGLYLKKIPFDSQNPHDNVSWGDIADVKILNLDNEKYEVEFTLNNGMEIKLEV